MQKEKRMKQYPIDIPINLYGGKNELKKQESLARIDLARKIERYINEQMKSESRPERKFLYAEISSAVSSTDSLVRDILFEFDGGYGGITIFKE